MNFNVAVKAIIEKDGKFLTIKRSQEEDVYKDLWDIPGGRLKFGEKPEDGLLREIFEETGLKVDIVKPFNVWSFITGDNLQIVGITFIAKYISGDVVLSNEHVDYKWIYPSDFSKLDVYESLKKELAKYSCLT